MPLSLRDRLQGWRDRLLADRGFQRFAALFPLTRPVATAEAAALFDLCAGFVYSQILFACVRLDIFRALEAGPMQPVRLAQRIGLAPEETVRLVRAAESLRLLEMRRDGRVGLGRRGAALLANPVVAAMVEHHALLYRDLADPVALLKGEADDTLLRSYWPYAHTDQPAELDPAAIDAYTRLMAASQSGVAEEVLDVYPMRGPTSLVDVGGGDGSFLEAVAARHGELALALFDLPPVAEIARARLKERGLEDRIEVHGGDFLNDRLPAGADVYSLIRILLDHPDDRVLRILAAIRRAIPPHGVLLIAEPLSGIDPGSRVADAYFGFYLRAMGQGRTRSLAEISALLAGAGFREPRVLAAKRPVLTRVVVARPQSSA